jgi:hypothetical protein
MQRIGAEVPFFSALGEPEVEMALA